MFENVFGIHEQALLLQGQRVGILATNLANADTPNYKARDIDFSAVLAHSDAAPLPLSVTDGAHIMLNDRDDALRRLEVPQSVSGLARRQYGGNAGGTGGFRGEQRALSGELGIHQFEDRGADAGHQRPVAAQGENMSLFNVFNTAGSALNAETIRLNTTASNLANAESVNGDPSKIYRARHPVFQTMMDNSAANFDQQDAGVGVRVLGVVESTAPPLMRYQPDNPAANKDGYVFSSNVNSIEEMTNMISANRTFATNVDAINTARDLLLKTISMGH